jgi:uncharacterized membrane protein YeaQ/YmgE (transglycosylase-associated protein family)
VVGGKMRPQIHSGSRLRRREVGDIMGWIIFIVVGGIIGWLASMVMKTNAQMGLLANVIVGIIGSALGGFIAGRMGLAPMGIGSWLVAIAGAVILIFLLKILGVFK